MADIYAMSVRFKEEGASAVEAALRKLSGSLAGTTAAAKDTDNAMGALAAAGKKLVAGLAIGATFKKFIDSTAEAEFVQAQLGAALKSTGNAAGTSIEALNAHADALMRVSVFDDEAIGSAQALLLTFTKIQGDVFPRATEAVLNVAQAMGGDLRGAAIQVGKALNDPVKGMAALSRSGIQFTEEQKALVESLISTGQTVKAQEIILKELDTQFGGSAAAARDTLGGAIKGLKNDFDNLFELGGAEAAPLVAAVNGLSMALVPLGKVIGGTIAIIIGGLTTIWTSLNNIYLAFMRFVNRIVQFFANFGAQLVKIAAMFTGQLTPEFDKAVDNWLKGFDYTEEALVQQQGEWKAWEEGIYDRLLGVREATAKPITPPPVGGGGGGGGAAPTMRAIEAPGRGVTVLGGVEGLGDEKIEAMRRRIPQAIGPVLTEAQKAAAEAAMKMEESISATISSALITGVVGGIENAIATGNIGEGFKALTTGLLAGLGDAMIQFGTQTAAFAQFMDKIVKGLYNLMPGSALAASIALIGLGAALKGAARGMFNKGGGSKGGSAAFSSMSFGGGSGSPYGQTTQLVFGSTSATTAAGMTPMGWTNFTIIGPNDPVAQRGLQEMLNNVNRRGRA
jgi:hypothetical protein